MISFRIRSTFVFEERLTNLIRVSKKLAEIICNTKYFCNFVFDGHSEECLYNFDSQYFEFEIIFSDHQFHRQLYFAEPTFIDVII